MSQISFLSSLGVCIDNYSGDQCMLAYPRFFGTWYNIYREVQE